MKPHKETNVSEIRVNNGYTPDDSELIQSIKSLEDYLRLLGEAIHPYVNGERQKGKSRPLETLPKLHLVK